jgi:hypothetical protein
MIKMVRISSVLALVLLAGCREITTTTRVFPDGSCERAVTIKGDSTSVDSVFAGTFPIPVDSTWTISGEREKTGEKKFAHTARKTFRSASDLDRAYRPPEDGKPRVAIDIRLDRRFRWFNTFYLYRETIKASNPFVSVPISDYLTPDELALYYLKEDTLGLDKKVEEWYLKTYFEELYRALAREAETNPDPGFGLETIRAGKDSLFAAVRRVDREKTSEISDGKGLVRFLERFYKTRAVRRWSSAMDSVMLELQKKQEFLMDLDADSYVNHVVMPGLILDTNAPSVENNTVTWELKGRRFFWEDYEMRVESRTVNRWAIWLTGGLLLVAVAGMAFGALRRRSP